MPYTLRHSKLFYKTSNNTNNYQPLDVLSQSSINDIISNWMNDWVAQNPMTIGNNSITSQHLQAGCINFSHLSDQLKNEIIMTPQNNYIIPDMYPENGESDDTGKFIRMLEDSEGKICIIPPKRYIISAPLTIPNGTVMIGCGKNSVLVRQTNSQNIPEDEPQNQNESQEEKEIYDADFLLVGGETDIGNFNIEIIALETDTSITQFGGAIIKIDADTLEDYARQQLNTHIHDISVLVKHIEGALAHTAIGKQTAALELSLQKNFNNTKTGFCNLTIRNYNVRCQSNELLGYYCKAYTNNNHWITGIEFNNCFILNTRWGIFPGKTDQDLFNSENFATDFSAICTQVQMQPNGTTIDLSNSLKSRAFCYVPYNRQVNIQLVGCIIWDFNGVKARDDNQEIKQYGYNFIFDYRRITERNNTGGVELDSVGSPKLLCGVEPPPNSESTDKIALDNCNFIQMNERDYGLILKYISNSFMKPSNIVATMPKLFYPPTDCKVIKLYEQTNTYDKGNTLIFKCISLNGPLLQTLVSIKWTSNSTNKTVSAQLNLSGGTRHIKFGYTVTQLNNDNTYYTISIYALQSQNLTQHLEVLSNKQHYYILSPTSASTPKITSVPIADILNANNIEMDNNTTVTLSSESAVSIQGTNLVTSNYFNNVTMTVSDGTSILLQFPQQYTMSFIAFQSLPFSNSVLGYDHTGAGSGYFTTLNLDKYTYDEIYFNAISYPNDEIKKPFDLEELVQLQQPKVSPVLIANPSNDIYELKLNDQNNITVSTKNYWAYTG